MLRAFLALLCCLQVADAPIVRTFTFHDGGATATIVEHELPAGTGEAGPAAHAGSGRMTLAYDGRIRSYDLADVFPVEHHYVQFFDSSSTGCGAAQPMLRAGDTVAIAYVWAEKGCRPDVAFVNVRTGAVATDVSVDHRYDHRFDIEPDRFTLRDRMLVHFARRIVLAQVRYGNEMHVTGSEPWPFALVGGVDQRGKRRLYAFEIPQVRLDSRPDLGRNVLPRAGSYVEIGTLSNRDDMHYVPEPFVLRFDVADDARYAALQLPEGMDHIRLVQRNEWFTKMEEDAADGRLEDALHAFAIVVGDDAGTTLGQGEREIYRQCVPLVSEVKAGTVSLRAARAAWPNSCRLATSSP